MVRRQSRVGRHLPGIPIPQLARPRLGQDPQQHPPVCPGHPGGYSAGDQAGRVTPKHEERHDGQRPPLPTISARRPSFTKTAVFNKSAPTGKNARNPHTGNFVQHPAFGQNRRNGPPAAFRKNHPTKRFCQNHRTSDFSRKYGTTPFRQKRPEPAHRQFCSSTLLLAKTAETGHQPLFAKIIPPSVFAKTTAPATFHENHGTTPFRQKRLIRRFSGKCQRQRFFRKPPPTPLHGNTPQPAVFAKNARQTGFQKIRITSVLLQNITNRQFPENPPVRHFPIKWLDHRLQNCRK